MKTLAILFVLLIAEMAFAERRGDHDVVSCDDGRTYRIQNGVTYVDGIPAQNGLLYFIRCYQDNSCSLTAVSRPRAQHEYYHSAVCYQVHPPPPPPPPPQVNWYEKSCDARGRCRWVSGYQN